MPPPAVSAAGSMRLATGLRFAERFVGADRMRAAATDAFERNRISTRRAASQFPSATQNVSAGAITQPRRRKPAFGGETCPALLASLGASTGRRAGTLDRTPRTGLRSRLGTLARSAKNDGRSTGKLSEARSCSSLGAPFAKREFAAGSNSPKWRRRHESEPATCRRSRTSASSSYRARPTPRVSSVPTPTTSASPASSSSTSTALASTPTGSAATSPARAATVAPAALRRGDQPRREASALQILRRTFWLIALSRQMRAYSAQPSRSPCL